MTHGPTRIVLAALAALTALLTAGCGDPAEPAAHGSPGATTAAATTTPTTAPSLPSKPYTVEQLAAKVGCTPKFVPGKLKDYRQASCLLDGDDFVFLDFQTSEGQRAWLDTATLYGGIYLSGRRWVLSGRSEEYMEQLRQDIGGTIEKGISSGS